MLSKDKFQQSLEEIGTKYFLENHGVIEKRGGNSKSNESYFRFVRKELLEKLNCGVLLLGKQDCPDSGIFANFNYLTEKEVDWSKVENGTHFAVRLKGDLDTHKFLLFPTLLLRGKDIKKDEFEDFEIDLNKTLKSEEFYGVEYKASNSDTPSSVTVASFNSTCPSGKKITHIKGTMIHNLAARGKKVTPRGANNELRETTWKIKLKCLFHIYYFIVNDAVEGHKSKIKHIVIVSGDFFGGNISPEKASELSKQLKPNDVGIKMTNERVKLRYRAFFEAPNIPVHNSYGLYVGWKPHNKDNPVVNDLAQCYTLEELYDMVA